MHDEFEKIESMKSRAFKPPKTLMRDDFKLFVRFVIFSLVISFAIYLSIAYILILTQLIKGVEFNELMVEMAFWGVFIFGILRTLRFSMAQIASDAYMIFPMSTDNVRGHLRELISMATSLQWDLTGLIGSLAVLIVFYNL